MHKTFGNFYLRDEMVRPSFSRNPTLTITWLLYAFSMHTVRKQEGRTMAAGVGQTNPVAELSLLVLSSHTLKHSTHSSRIS